MSKVALFPGSFNPWHEGHEDVLNQALKAFDKVVIMRAVNPEKEKSGDMEFPPHLLVGGRIEIVEFTGLLRDFVAGAGYAAIVKGIRNQEDFEYEKMQQYFNEDLGINTPIFFVIANRNMVHKSSTFIRALRKFKK
jgi:pantetheine-phosphate adenylyltransferase